MEFRVRGEHTLRLRPELGTLHLSVAFESGAKPEALRQTSTTTSELVTELKRLVTLEHPPISNYVAQPVSTMSWRPFTDDGPPLPVRYRASAELTVEFTDFDALSDFALMWGERAGVQIGGVEWSLGERTERDRRDEVLTAAVLEARDRATVMARAVGVREVHCLEVADQGLLARQTYAGPESMRDVAFLKGAPQIEIRPQDVEVTAQVDARFAGEPASGTPS